MKTMVLLVCIIIFSACEPVQPISDGQAKLIIEFCEKYEMKPMIYNSYGFSKAFCQEKEKITN